MSKPFPPSAHWRDSARSARFFVVDFRAAIPIFLSLLYWSYLTFGIALASTLFFYTIERFGFTVPVFFRALRAWLAGGRKMASPWWK